jgi:3-hydroxyacyl-CoA dehydrogenase
MIMTQFVSVDYHGDIALIRIQNPPVNAISHGVRAGLVAALDVIAQSDAKAIVLTGDGRGFSGGADISEFGGQPTGGPDFDEIIERFERSAKPVVAAIHGIALGGGLELALGCAYRVAAADAQLGLPEVKIGILPGAGGTQRLPRLIGPKDAIDRIVSGDPMSGQTGKTQGIVD